MKYIIELLKIQLANLAGKFHGPVEILTDNGEELVITINGLEFDAKTLNTIAGHLACAHMNYLLSLNPMNFNYSTAKESTDRFQKSFLKNQVIDLISSLSPESIAKHKEGAWRKALEFIYKKYIKREA